MLRKAFRRFFDSKRTVSYRDRFGFSGEFARGLFGATLWANISKEDLENADEDSHTKTREGIRGFHFEHSLLFANSRMLRARFATHQLRRW